MVMMDHTLPWTRCPGDFLHGQARLCVAVLRLCHADLREHETRVLWQLLAADEGQRFVQAVSDWTPCSETPSAACIHPPAPEGSNIYHLN